MSLVINHNMMSIYAAGSLSKSYNSLTQATKRLSSGLRINSAADDPAGMAVSELMKSDVSTFTQGVRNLNDAVSMIQTADGAMSIIDEKLIRMKELAEQAASGTYTSDQRCIIDSEYQAMASEITRIASATKFNGIYLLNGNLASNTSNGHGLNPTGKLKVHFGTGNSSAEDYYYIQIGNCTAGALGVGSAAHGSQYTFSELLDEAKKSAYAAAIKDGKSPSEAEALSSSDRSVAELTYDQAYSYELNEAKNNAYWATFSSSNGTTGYGGTFEQNYADSYASQFTSMRNNGFSVAEAATNSNKIALATALTATYTPAGVILNPPNDTAPNATFASQFQNNFLYQFESSSYLSSITTSNATSSSFVKLHIDNAIKSAISSASPIASNAAYSIVEQQATASGAGAINRLMGSWLSSSADKSAFANRYLYGSKYKPVAGMTISTQEAAQAALVALNSAIVSKDKIRASLGAMQNRLDNTISNIETQAENLLAAESQITDVDVATEMTEYVRQQILSQSAVAMLTQANSFPKMALQLIQG